MTLLALDVRLGRVLIQMKEPMLAQIRLAWWRDMLGKPIAQRPTGDSLLAACAVWEGQEIALCSLVDGWEGLLAEAPLPDASIHKFVDGRVSCFGALTILLGIPTHRQHAEDAARRWAFADLAAGITDQKERAQILTLASLQPQTAAMQPLPRSLRSLTVLAGLAERSLKHEAAPLLGKRGSLLLALRLGIFGR